jgi:hypothetical protein
MCFTQQDNFERKPGLPEFRLVDYPPKDVSVRRRNARFRWISTPASKVFAYISFDSIGSNLKHMMAKKTQITIPNHNFVPSSNILRHQIFFCPIPNQSWREIQPLAKVATRKKGGQAKRPTLSESNIYFVRHATTTKHKSESHQELKQHVIVVFHGLYQIQLSPRLPDNDADLAIRNNRSYLVNICRIMNIAHIFGFTTLFSLPW